MWVIYFSKYYPTNIADACKSSKPDTINGHSTILSVETLATSILVCTLDCSQQTQLICLTPTKFSPTESLIVRNQKLSDAEIK